MRKWAGLIAAALTLAGCASGGGSAGGDGGDAAVTSKDPAARAFSGLIVSLRPRTETMLISKGNKPDSLNIVKVVYDRNSVFTLDGAPVALDQIRQFMPVKMTGHMTYPDGAGTEGQMVVDRADFSSAIPQNSSGAATQR